jgi:hypothetical protein
MQVLNSDARADLTVVLPCAVREDLDGPSPYYADCIIEFDPNFEYRWVAIQLDVDVDQTHQLAFQGSGGVRIK